MSPGKFLCALKQYLPTFSNEISKVFVDCKIEIGYDPTEPDEREVKRFGEGEEFEDSCILPEGRAYEE